MLWNLCVLSHVIYAFISVSVECEVLFFCSVCAYLLQYKRFFLNLKNFCSYLLFISPSIIENENKTEIVKISYKNQNSFGFKNFGAILSAKQEIRIRKTLTISAINNLWKLWKREKLSTRKKVRSYNAYVMLILLYKCGNWALTKTDKTSLNSFHLRLLRQLVAVFCPKILKSEKYTKEKKMQKLSSLNFEARSRSVQRAMY